MKANYYALVDLVVMSSLGSIRRVKAFVWIDRVVEFRLTKVNVPYAPVWYVVQNFIVHMGGCSGGEEIDKLRGRKGEHPWVLMRKMYKEPLNGAQICSRLFCENILFAINNACLPIMGFAQFTLKECFILFISMTISYELHVR